MVGVQQAKGDGQLKKNDAKYNKNRHEKDGVDARKHVRGKA
jgi:major membrane immunogen (membrane-anchored lipoprotein)